MEVESIAMANDLINDDCVMKPPSKPKRIGFARASRLVGTWTCGESGAPGEGMVAPTLPHTLPGCLFHLALPEFYPGL